MSCCCECSFNNLGVERKKVKEVRKEKLAELIQEPHIKYQLQRRKHYCMPEQMLVLLDYSQQPLEGKFRSAAIEERKGKLHFILIEKSTAAIIDHYSRQHLDGYLIFQRYLAEKAGLKSFHSIIKGRIAYFSVKGMTQGNCDWFSLHNHEAADRQRDRVVFSHQGLEVSIKCSRHCDFMKNLSHAVKLNRLFLDCSINEGYCSMRAVNQKSLICNEDYYGKLLNEKLLTGLIRNGFEEKMRLQMMKLVLQLLKIKPEEKKWYAEEINNKLKEIRQKQHLH